MSFRVTAVGEQTSLADRKRRAGQRLVIGLASTAVDAEFKALVKRIQPAGFILFARNVEEPAQVIELNRELSSLLPQALPPLLTVDQEGGRVQRIREGATKFPPLRWLGNTQNAELTREHARFLAAEVAALGFHLNWAPVADVDSNPKNPVIGDRSFGRDPQQVAQQVATWIQATQAAGIIACAKHFPGHGDTSVDSHLDLPVVEKEAPELEEVELAPFRGAIRAGVAAIMTAHVVYPEWDEHHPATMSSKILRGILREKLGFKGLLVSDDMEMKAVRGRYPLEEQLFKATRATVDIFLCCESPDLQLEAYENLVHLQESDPLYDQLMMDSDRRLLTVRERFLKSPPQRDPQLLGASAHTNLALKIRALGES
ncbi:MAG: beta-N-acetylhexosaminidase [Myxococcota bacterium]|nr:beta-N-acetylhexosaminidase [Myxococcota bacterium]